MSLSASFLDCRVALRQRLVRKAKTEEDNPQGSLRVHVWVESSLMNKRAVCAWIIKRKRLFQMRSRQTKPAD